MRYLAWYLLLPGSTAGPTSPNALLPSRFAGARPKSLVVGPQRWKRALNTIEQFGDGVP